LSFCRIRSGDHKRLVLTKLTLFPFGNKSEGLCRGDVSQRKQLTIALNNFNAVFGQRIAGAVLPVAIEEFQAKRAQDGITSAAIDVELNI
jgi:hypothetical protein